MSQSGIQYALQESLGGTERLLIHYDEVVQLSVQNVLDCNFYN